MIHEAYNCSVCQGFLFKLNNCLSEAKCCLTHYVDIAIGTSTISPEEAIKKSQDIMTYYYIINGSLFLLFFLFLLFLKSFVLTISALIIFPIFFILSTGYVIFPSCVVDELKKVNDLKSQIEFYENRHNEVVCKKSFVA